MPDTLEVANLQDICMQHFCLHLSELAITSDQIVAEQTARQEATATHDVKPGPKEIGQSSSHKTQQQDAQQAAKSDVPQGNEQETGTDGSEEAQHEQRQNCEQVTEQEASGNVEHEAVKGGAIGTEQENCLKPLHNHEQGGSEGTEQKVKQGIEQEVRAYLLSNVPPCFFEQLVHDTLTIINKHFYNPKYKRRRPAMVAVAGWLLGDHVRHLCLDQCRMLCDRLAVPHVLNCLRHMPRLQTLAIGRLNFWKIPELDLLPSLLSGLPQLTTLRLEYICLPEMVAGLADKCPLLQELSLKDSEKVTDHEVRHIRRCLRLKSLNISGTSITGAGSWQILCSLPSLTWFEHCPFNCNSGPFLFDSREAMLSCIWASLSPEGRAYSGQLPSVTGELALPPSTAAGAAAQPGSEADTDAAAGAGPAEQPGSEADTDAAEAGTDAAGGAGPAEQPGSAADTDAAAGAAEQPGLEASTDAAAGAGPVEQQGLEADTGAAGGQAEQPGSAAGTDAAGGAGPAEQPGSEAGTDAAAGAGPAEQPGSEASTDAAAAGQAVGGEETEPGRQRQAGGTAGQAGGTAGQAGGTAGQAGGTDGQAGGTAGQAGPAVGPQSPGQAPVAAERRAVSPLPLSRSDSGSGSPRRLLTENFWLFNPKTEEVALSRLCPAVRLLRLDFVFQDMGRSPELAGLTHLRHVTRLEINSFDAPRFSVLCEVLRQLGGRLTELALHVCDDYTATASLETAVARWCPRLQRYAFTGDYSVRQPAERGDDELEFGALRRRHPALQELTLGGFVTGRRLLFLLAHATGLRRLRLDGELRHLDDAGFSQLLAVNPLLQLQEMWVNVSSSLTLQALLPLVLESRCALRRLGRLSSLQGLDRAGFIELRRQVRRLNLALELVWVTPGV